MKEAEAMAANVGPDGKQNVLVTSTLVVCRSLMLYLYGEHETLEAKRKETIGGADESGSSLQKVFRFVLYALNACVLVHTQKQKASQHKRVAKSCLSQIEKYWCIGELSSNLQAVKSIIRAEIVGWRSKQKGISLLMESHRSMKNDAHFRLFTAIAAERIGILLDAIKEKSKAKKYLREAHALFGAMGAFGKQAFMEEMYGDRYKLSKQSNDLGAA